MTRSSTALLVWFVVGLSLLDCRHDPSSAVPPKPPGPTAAQAGDTAKAAACGDAPGGGNVAAVVATAIAFRDALPANLRAMLQQPLSRATAIVWSNLPVKLVPRTGVRLGDLDATQSAAARRLFAAATTSCGLAMIDEVRLSDDVLATVDKRGLGWGAGNFYIAFLGAPSERAPWMLQVGGHHLAYNFTFNGERAGATPLFFGTEPTHFTTNDGAAHEPLKEQSTAMFALARAIAARPSARLSGKFTDVVKGVVINYPPGQPPTGGLDTAFPLNYPTGTADRGIRVDALAADEQALVRRAIESYASLPAQSVAGELLKAYEAPAAFGETYVGWAGDADLSKVGTYVRIDGPRGWMEFVVQAGIAFPDKPHYHALWRDKESDYGGEAKQ
jgi:Protein of unknown function (DUF3500)